MLTHHINERFFEIETKLNEIYDCLAMNLEIVKTLVEERESLRLRVEKLEATINKVYP